MKSSTGRTVDLNDVFASEIEAVVGEVGDAAGSTSTTASMSVGDSFQGSLQSVGDTDWIEITLTNGEWYGVDLFGDGGSGVSDTYLRIYDSGGNLLYSNDDAGSGLNSYLEFAATYTGTYYIEADSYGNNLTGDYQVDVATVAAPSPTDALVWGGADWDSSQTINVYFALSGTTVDDDGTTLTSDGFSQTEIDAILGIFSNVTSFANISFAQTTDQSKADIQLATDDLGGSLLGYMYPQGTSSTDGLGVFTSNSTYWNAASMSVGGFMYSVIVHELGHGLGLAHPHDTGGGSDVMTGVSGSGDTGDYGGMNQSIFTIMSYNDSWDGHPLGMPADYGSGYMSTFAALDISVLQDYYGANIGYNSGNTTYDLGSSGYYMTIWDGGGKDKIVVSGSDDAVINLRAASLDYAVGGAGFVSYTSGTIGGFTIANGVVIENATGSGGDDTITGNSSKNVLKGKGGADTISGRGGKDIVKGGGGQDTLDGGGDADVIKGNNGKDTLIGGDGNDVLDGGKGADIFEFDLDDGNDDVVKFSEKDVFDLSGLGLTYGTIGISITGTTAVVTFGTTVVSILDLQADLDFSDFMF